MKSSEISQILLELSKERLDKDSDSLAVYAERFKLIFLDGYRQRYSEIRSMLEHILSEQEDFEESSEEEDQEDCLDQLSNNLAIVREYVRLNICKLNPETYKGVFKLSDHIDIEIRRYRDIQHVYYGLYSAKSSVTSVSEEANELNRKMDEALRNAQNLTQKLQMQIVAILGIFAAIVVAFSGGIDLLSGAISVSGSSNIINVTFAILLCSIVLFNILAFLMYMIIAILKLNEERVKASDMNKTKSSKRGKLSNRLDSFVGSRFIIAFNFVMVLALGIDAALMYLIA